MSEAQVKNKLQIIHCSKQNHWIVASTVNYKLEEVLVYDSLFSTIDKETRKIIQNLFQATLCKRLDMFDVKSKLEERIVGHSALHLQLQLCFL